MHSNLTILEKKERKLERKKLREREKERKTDTVAQLLTLHLRTFKRSGI